MTTTTHCPDIQPISVPLEVLWSSLGDHKTFLNMSLLSNSHWLIKYSWPKPAIIIIVQINHSFQFWSSVSFNRTRSLLLRAQQYLPLQSRQYFSLLVAMSHNNSRQLILEIKSKLFSRFVQQSARGDLQSLSRREGPFVGYGMTQNHFTGIPFFCSE